ncbi:MAG: PAS domain S-box protein [Anaerolineales bacterium]|nr:PAS domain S-box protein [Anaerolineales bacterium]
MLNRFHRLFAPPIFADEEKTRISQFMINFLWFAICVIFLLIISRFVIWTDASLIPIFTLAAIIPLLLFIQYIVRLGYVYAASVFAIFSLWGMMTFLAWCADGIRDLAVIAYIVVIILSSFLLGWRFASVVGGLSMAVIWYFAIMEKQGARILHVDDPISYARDLSSIIILVGILMYMLITGWSRTLQSARLELQERLRAEEKLQRQADYLVALNETALGLLNRSELQPLLESILTRACDLLNTKHGLIDLVLPDGSALRQDVGHGVLSKYNGTLTYKNEGVTGNVWASGQQLTVQDYRAWNKGLPEFIDAGFSAVMGVPLKVGSEIIGVLAISFVEQERMFTQEQVNLMERFAALASLAIDNARLYELAQKEIHERSMAEFALRASEERFRKVFHASPVAIIISSLEDGRVIEANNAYWKLTGFNPPKSVDRTAIELGVWDNEDERKKFVDQLKSDHSIYDPEYQFINKAGESISTLAFYELIEIKGQACILSMFYDVTEQKQARGALRASEERFRKVFNNSYVAISIVTLEDGKFLEANSAFWQLSGLQSDTALGHTSLELNMWDDPQKRRDFVQELLEKRSLQNVHVEFKQENQPNRTTIAFYELLDIENELCILCMFYDVSEQRQAERALKENEERMRAILASIPDMIFEISSTGILLDFMASSEIAPLMPPSEFLGRNIKEVFPPVIAAQTFFALERALATGQLHAFEYELSPAGETRFFEARVISITSESAIIMVRDISQRKYVQTEREKLINELEEKNGELERFTYTVSHDLKSPLITIKGFLGFLEQDAASGNVVRLKADIQRIASAADKMQLLLNELLELTRVGRLMNPYQNISFEELAHEAVELVHGQIQSKGIYVSIQENLPTVYGDRRRLIEVIQNLIDNAAKFVGNQAHPRIEIGLNGYEDDKPIFYVKDNGMGIEPVHHDRIFGLFNKLDANSDGTGIGLALVKRIIEVHGGRIWVQSEVEKGATFFFTLQTEPAA